MSGAPALRLILLAAIAAAALALSVSIGAAGIPPGDVLRALQGEGSEGTQAIVLQLRLPRAALAVLVGGGLGVAGAVFQALVRNPLAEPYVMGISGGAAVGAVAALMLGWAARAPAALPLAAFAGAALTVLLVFRVATGASRVLDTRVLLLAGVVAGAFANAVIMLLLTLGDLETYRSAIVWIMGSLGAASWPAVVLIALYVGPALLVLLALARPLNLLAIGDETALHLGTNVRRVKLTAYLVASFLVAATVAACGVIGFVGLVVPHALRLLWGSDHRFLLPGCALAGAAFLLLADTAARTVASPAELPVGVVTALIGVPFFVVLLRRRSA